MRSPCARRALEDVYSSKGGSLRTGGDFRCFHLDVAGFYRSKPLAPKAEPVDVSVEDDPAPADAQQSAPGEKGGET